MTPQRLTTDDVLRLQRTIGNRAVGKVIAQAVQRKPVLDDAPFYKDDQYPDVTLEEVGPSLYKIINDGEYENLVVYYDVDMRKYYRTDHDEEFGYLQNEEEFDVGLVSSGPAVQAEVPSLYEGIGEEGRGVGYVKTDTTLRTTGLITCVGWLLYSAKAAYLTHVVVLDPKNVVADGSIKAQVQGLYDAFVEATGSNPTTVMIQVDEDQQAYNEPLDWFDELVPDSCTAEYPSGSDLSHVVHPSEGNRVEWRGAPIKVKYKSGNSPGPSS